MKIYILDPFHPAGLEYAAKHAEIVRWDDPRVKSWPEEADGVMVRGTRIQAADLARAKKLKIISKQGVGYDNIDVVAAKKHGIPVVRMPGVNKEAVAEMALVLGLAVLIGRRELALMKPTAILVNTSRGGVVDEQAVDVLIGKPPVAENRVA